MSFDLPQLARQQGRRRSIALRPIIPTSAQATELAAIIMPAATIWRDAIPAIMAGYNPAPLAIDAHPEYTAVEAGALIAPGECARLTDSPDAISAAINATAADVLTRLVISITPGLRSWALRTERWHRRKWAAAVAAGTGVQLETVLTAGPVAETVETFVQRNVALVRNISDQAEARIADAVFRGYQQRLPAREVATELREAAGFARARAVRVASDQSSKLSAALDRERQAEAGLDSFKWRHSGKLHPRQEHRVRDGKVYPLDDPKLRGDMPGDKPFCGCRAQAWIPLLNEIA